MKGIKLILVQSIFQNINFMVFKNIILVSCNFKIGIIDFYCILISIIQIKASREYHFINLIIT